MTTGQSVGVYLAYTGMLLIAAGLLQCLWSRRLSMPVNLIAAGVFILLISEALL